MAEYEILTRLRNGGKRPLEIGKVVDLDEVEGKRLVAIGALRLVAGTKGGKPSFLTATLKMRTELEKLTVKKLDALAEAERIELDASANKPDKVETIVKAKAGQLLSILDRAELLDVASADAIDLPLANEATDEDIRVALINAAVAQAS